MVDNVYGKLTITYTPGSYGAIKFNGALYLLSVAGGSIDIVDVDKTFPNTIYADYNFETSSVDTLILQTVVTWKANVVLYEKDNYLIHSGNHDFDTLIHKPDLARVAVTGQYSDLLNPPTIPTIPDNTALLMNVALNKFINGVIATASVPNNYGTVTIYLNFTGNSSTYNWSVHFYGSGTYDTSGSCGANGSFTHTFATGTYYMTCSASTSGSGNGSTYTTPDSILMLIVGVTDSIGVPSVALTGSCSVTGTSTNVNGVPFWTSGSGVVFPAGSLTFYNVKNVIDPTVLRKFITCSVDEGGANKTHAEVFGSTTLALNMTNTNQIVVGFNEGWMCQEYAAIKPCNINYPNGGTQSTMVSGIYFLPYGFLVYR